MFALLKVAALAFLASGCTGQTYTGTCKVTEGTVTITSLITNGNPAASVISKLLAGFSSQQQSLAAIGKSCGSLPSTYGTAVGSALLAFLNSITAVKSICAASDTNFCLKDNFGVLILEKLFCKQCPAGQTLAPDTTYCTKNPGCAFCNKGTFPACATPYFLTCQPSSASPTPAPTPSPTVAAPPPVTTGGRRRR